MGQTAQMVAPPSWKGACPVRLPAGWLWLRGWLSVHWDRLPRMSDHESHTPLFVGLARARFGLGIATSGLSAAWEKAAEGRAP